MFPNNERVSEIESMLGGEGVLIYRIEELNRPGYGSIPFILVGGHERMRNDEVVVAELDEEPSLLDVWGQIVEREGLPRNTGIRVSGDDLVMYEDIRISMTS